MNARFPLWLATAALLVPAASIAAGSDALSSLHPEEAYPDNVPMLHSPGPYEQLNRQVQERLRQLDFDPGPINGHFGAKTQTALAQFQLSRALPASGMLDDTTLAAMGLERYAEAPADAGATSATAEQDAGEQRRCDELMGQEKERCLQLGGTVKANAQSGSGATGN